MASTSPHLMRDGDRPRVLPPLLPQLASVLAKARADADCLARYGHTTMATTLRDTAADVEDAVRPCVKFLAETDALIFSGLKVRALRKQFTELEPRGLAFREGETRFYCEAALRHNATLIRAHADGRAAASGRAA
jgi:hypothetical protein